MADAPKARILYTSADRFPPFRVDVEVLFAQKLSAMGYDIDWVLQSEADLDTSDQVQWRGGTVYRGATDNGEKFFNRLRRHIRGFRNDLRLVSVLKLGEHDMALVKDKFVASIITMLATANKPIDFVYWLSYPFPEASLYNAKIGTARYPLLYRIRGKIFSYILYQQIAKRAAHIFVQSEQMKRDMAERGVPTEKMTAVPMGFLPDTEGAQKQPPIKAGQMVYIGTLLKTRKLDFLVRVLDIVRKTKPNATLLYVGPEELPGDMAVLEAEAERLGLTDAVTLTGRLPREEAFQIVRESEVCFSPFYPTPILNSTSPTKLIEYMALSKAPVANDHPEQRDVLAESQGGLCTAYDEHAFAEAALWLMDHPTEAAEMGQRGYEYVMQHRTYDALSQLVDEPLTKLVGARH